MFVTLTRRILLSVALIAVLCGNLWAGEHAGPGGDGLPDAARSPGTRPTTDQSKESAETLLRRALAATNWTQNMHEHVSIRVRAVESKEGDFIPAPPYVEHSTEVEIFESGLRLRIIRQNGGENGFDGAHVDTLVIPGQRVFWVRGSQVELCETQSLIDGDYATFDRGSCVAGWFLDGVAVDRFRKLLTLAAAIKQGRLQTSVSTELIGGVESRAVDITGDNWSLHLAVVPSRDFNIGLYRYKSKADRKSGGREQYINVDHFKYQQLADGRWVVGEARYVDTEPNEAGDLSSLQVIATRTLVETSPDFDRFKAFETPPVPDGEPATINRADANGRLQEDNLGVLYMWKDGKVVPAYDPNLVERIRKSAKPTTRPN